MKKKLEDKFIWFLKRYGFAEIGSIIGAYGSFFLFNLIFHNLIISSFAGSIGESVGYYTVIIFRELIFEKNSEHRLFTRVVHLLTEFGPAEILDVFFFRPLFMGLCSHFFGPYLGVLLGKLLADITFYIPVIISYQLRQEFYKQKNKKDK